MSAYVMTIDGASATAKTQFEVLDPATGRAFASAPECDDGQLDRAVSAAHRAFEGWRRDEGLRRRCLARCAEVLEAHTGSLAELLTREQGKPLAKARGEIKRASDWFRWAAGVEIPVLQLQDDARARVEVRRRPLGVVAAITPWNYPVLLAVWKLAPALLTGNTVVLKPSPFTPLSSLEMARVLQDALPRGVFNAISGGDDLGARLTRQAQVRKISFTGSVATGKKVAAAAAPDLKRVTLELGGNDAAVVLPDVDPARVAKKLFWGAFENSGQVCTAIKRLFVPEAMHDELVQALSDTAGSVRIGPGTEDGVELGPINNRPQLERVEELRADAAASGGELIGAVRTVPGEGFFFAPTLVLGLSEGSRLVDEEQFGPLLPILPYADLDEAVARANATRFGLGASVWSTDPERAQAVAERLEAGTVWVNQHIATAPHIPFGGAKWSGIGIEHSQWGLLEYTGVQVINRKR